MPDADTGGLVVRSEEPPNAETRLDLLCRSDITPTELFFVRAHGAVPQVDPAAYRLVVSGAVTTPLELSLGELRERFPQASIAASLVCAGNRRRDLEPLPSGIPWDAGAIGNAVWTGVRLRDLLVAAGAEPDARHIELTGLDDAELEGRRVSFGGSVPLEKALAPEVLLAYEMNGAPLTPEHGFPLRAVVPGHIGARSVKWLSSVSVRRSPSRNPFETDDYALDGRPLRELPLNSAICLVDGGRAAGYAIAGGGRRIVRVEVSADGGKTWRAAVLDEVGTPWTWRLWHASLEDVEPDRRELVVRAWDSAGNGQPASGRSIWNAKGYMNNAWHRVEIDASGRGLHG